MCPNPHSLNLHSLRAILNNETISVDDRTKLLLALNALGDYYRALSELEITTTNFVLNALKYMTELPKQEFELLLPALTEARDLLSRES